MISSQLQFTIANQTIERVDEFNVVGDSQNYLRAKFNFITDEWSDLIKTALFRNGKDGTVYEAILQDDECLVPHEVLAGKSNYMFVSVFAGELITVNTARVYIEDSGYWSDAESSVDPTPSVYQQVMDRLANVEDTVVESAQSASESAESASNSAESASASAESASADAQIAHDKAELASASALSAINSENNASDYATTSESWAVGGTNTRAGEDTNNAKYYAEIARRYAEVDWSTVVNTPTTLDGYGVHEVPVSMLDGVIGIEHIPHSAIERIFPVANDEARFALTTDDVQNGDTVKVMSTGLMYVVVDDTKLDRPGGYMDYSVGSAASVPWSGVTNHPTTLAGYGITDPVQENRIEKIKKNGNELTINYDKSVNIEVPTRTAELVNDSNYVSDGSYVHTDNNYTSDDKQKLSGIENGAEVNVIKNIKKNGTALTPDANKAVDIIVPTKTSDLTNDSDFVEDADYVHTDNNYTSTEKQKLNGIEAGAQVNVNADWSATSGKSEILHKPTTIDGYGITDAYTKSEIDAKVSSTYKPGGSLAFASLPALIASNLGYVYNVTDAFTTTSDFVEGSGKTHPAGTNVAIVDVGNGTYKYDALAGFVDLSGYVQKETGKGLSTNDYTTNDKNKLDDIEAGAEVNVNPDWNATSGKAEILHKPTSIAGYGITDAYTKSETDASLSALNSAKVDKVQGKGLSTNDYTNTDKQAVQSFIATGLSVVDGMLQVTYIE